MNETDKILLAIEDSFQCYPLLDAPFDIKIWEKAYQSDFPSSTNQPASNEMLEIWCRNNGIMKIWHPIKGCILKKINRF